MRSMGPFQNTNNGVAIGGGGGAEAPVVAPLMPWLQLLIEDEECV